ncbi:hypothetical protein EBR57_04835 [bacterium]|nr:hypothetical protein [bacterium]
MEWIAHRINTIAELEKTPTEFGVELDLRDVGDELVLQHDPFSTGERFEDYLKHYRHGTIILNIKSERIEWRVLELIEKYQIPKYFFLDSSFPMIVQLSKKNELNTAIRFSEFEGMDTVRAMAGKSKWVWIDSFTDLTLTGDQYRQMKAWGYQLCLVSPDLQSRPDDIFDYKAYLDREEIVMDAICCKTYNRPLWER